MYIYIACLSYRYYCYNSSFTNLFIANIDSFSNLDNSVYTILAPTPAKLAKITPAIRYTAACKAKRRKSAKACATAGRVAAAKRSKKEGLQCFKRTTSGNAGRYTTNSGLTANKDNNNAYNRAYVPPTNIEEEEGSSGNNNGVNSGTSDSTDKGKGSSAYKRSKGTSRYKDTLLYKQQYITSYPYSPPSIKFSTSAPYIHEQNGLVERSVRVILDLELVNSIAITNKETTPFQALFDELEPSIPHIPNLERYRAIGARGEAIIPLEKRSKSLKFTSRTEECKLLAVLGSKTSLVYIPSRRAVLKTSTVKFIEDNTVLSQPTNNTALEGELVDLDLDLEGAVSPDPSNLNTKKPISIEIGPSKLEPYESSSNKPIFAPKPIEVIAPNQPITNEPLDNSDLISEGDKMQLDYYKLLAKTSSYILSFVYKARKRVISKDSTPTTYKQVLKLPRDERSKWLEAITKEFIQLLELGFFKFLPRSLLPSNRVFYNAKTCHFIVTYIDDCLFIGPNIGYITDLKKRLNKVYAIEDLGPATYFLGVQIIRDRPNRRL
ncbi:hypothetical protein P8C59_003681 [Phyllachora maydis]|uniref:Reverse transcriptase Ty1/copia-type domain-containing protein n=1 Tax=Phyllachora maydis TaxID=1825666 RepID=A0AAD9M9I6_9PEZI|nr:hypothetical protein P8C59_003681 [Phyllachora maydis]